MDLHSDSGAENELLTTCQDTGETIPQGYALATDTAGVRRRGRSFEVIARATAGLMGRSPDFLATLLASWYAAKEVFGRKDRRFTDNIANHYRYARRHNLCHTHAISDPPRDRFADDSVEPLTLRKVRQTADGIVVRGVKMLATLAPLADELLVYPFRPLTGEEAAQALAFSIPVSTAGLRIMCRQPLARGTSEFDAPLSERFDEMDALCVFDDVTVPWERVFLDSDVELANLLRRETKMTTYQWHQSSVRAAVKAELFVGVASLLARASGRDRQSSTRAMLGEMAAMAEALRALVRAAEEASRAGPGGYHVPATASVGASGALSTVFFPRFVEFLQLIGSSGLVMHPTERDLEGTAAALLNDYFTATDMRVTEYVALLKLAAELAIGGFGGRHLLYERFYLGPPEVLRDRVYQEFDRESAEEFVRGLLLAPESRVPEGGARTAGAAAD